MRTELAFVKWNTHRAILEHILDDAERDSEVVGVLLLGSVARGDAYPDSDLDVDILLRDGLNRTFRPAVRDGVLVECKYADRQLAESKIANNPSEVYAYIDGRVLYDAKGSLDGLTRTAHSRFDTYAVSPADREQMAYILSSAKGKIEAAAAAGDQLRAAYMATVNAWKILEGLWAANAKPMPPVGAVWAHIKDLSTGPSPIDAAVRRLFDGDAPGRIQAAVQLIDAIVPT